MKLLLTIDFPHSDSVIDIYKAIKQAIHKENVLTQGIGALHEAHISHGTNEMVPKAALDAETELVAYYEERIPEWEKGYTLESSRMQSLLNRVLDYQKLLGNNDHTMCMAVLKELVEGE